MINADHSHRLTTEHCCFSGKPRTAMNDVQLAELRRPGHLLGDQTSSAIT